MIINYKKSFIKQFKKAPNYIKNQTKARCHIFSEDKNHYSLKNHALKGKYQGCRSINITGDWRVIYIEIDEKNIMLIALGTHSQLYK